MFNAVLKLTNVAGPIIIQKCPHGLIAKILNVMFAKFGDKVFLKMYSQDRNVIFS